MKETAYTSELKKLIGKFTPQNNSKNVKFTFPTNKCLYVHLLLTLKWLKDIDAERERMTAKNIYALAKGDKARLTENDVRPCSWGILSNMVASKLVRRKNKFYFITKKGEKYLGIIKAYNVI